MSRARTQTVVSTPSSAPTAMGPPPDRDVVMGPPPLPSQMSTANLSQPLKPLDQDVVAKYSSLKRKYFDLEEKYKEATAELQRSGERNVRLRQERSILLDRIIELEAITNGPTPSPSQPHSSLQLPSSSAFPRSLVSQSARNHFANNLRQAMVEIEHEDPNVDPLFTSRHVGPLGRKRDDERDRRIREAIAQASQRGPVDESGRKGVKRTRGGGTKAREGDATPPVLVSSGGTRLRLKPPAPPGPSVGLPGIQQHPFQQPPSMISPHSHHAHAPGPSRQLSDPDLRTPQYSYPPPGSPHDEREGQHLSPAGATSFRPGTPPGYFHHPAQPLPPPSVHGHVQSPPLTVSSPRADRSSKPKRLKAHTVASKVYNIPTIPRDKKGKPILPLNVGIMTVYNLGEVCMREHFHTERYIFPVGYEVQRRYLSMKKPDAEVCYKCVILDGGDGPKFQIVPADDPQNAIIAGTATGAWAAVVKQANQIRNRQHSNSVSGPDFFGLGQNTIKHLIQELPGADMLRDYVWQHFVEGGRPLGGRHAAVIPALPDDQEGYRPQYPTQEQEQELYLRERERERAAMEYEREEEAMAARPLNIRMEYGEDGRGERSRRRNSRASENGHAVRSPLQGPGSHERPYTLAPPRSPQSAYRGSNGSFHSLSTSPVPPVPAGLASIMNAYPAPGSRPSGSPGSDSDYRRGGLGS